MTPVEKAAVLLASLDTATADRLLDRMDAELAQRLRNSVLALERIPAEGVRKVLHEFATHRPESLGPRPETNKRGRPVGSNPPPAHPALQPRGSAPGRGTSATHIPLEDTWQFSDPQLLQFERPQTIAAIVAASTANQARQYMDALPVNLQADVVHRLAKLGTPRTDIMRKVLQQLEEREKFESLPPEKFDEAALDTVRQLLPRDDGPSRDAVLEALARVDAELAERLSGVAFDDDRLRPMTR